ncbi:MAG: serine/threonine protein kinase [Bacteroidales bacterium]|nr:serine/threonine protein kinase [Bacteroidales bacterium]
MPDISDISTSGKVTAQDIRVSSKFTDFTELPSKGHCRLTKAQRYGMWNVLKGLKPQYSSNQQYVEMLSKEFAMMVGLTHPNIVRTYGHENVPELGECIVMEYVDGRTLANFIAEKPSLEQRKQVVTELVDALSYCHKKQIVHQDIKPSNILITHDGNHVKIIDFGLSDSHEWAILKEPAYTKAYAAPEQLAGEEVDNRTDIYAFGIILRQLFPKRYGSVSRKCLQPQREKRYSSVEAVLNDIRRADSRRKRMPIVAIVLTILIGLAIFIGSRFVQKEMVSIIDSRVLEEEKFADSLPQKQEIAVNTKTESVQYSQAKSKTTEVSSRNETENFTTQSSTTTEMETPTAKSEAEKQALDQAISDFRLAIDSMFVPVDLYIQSEELKTSNILHDLIYIAEYKAKIRECKVRKQLPKSKRTYFFDYANSQIEAKKKTYTQKYPSIPVFTNEQNVRDAEIYQPIWEQSQKYQEEGRMLYQDWKKQMRTK